MQITEQDYLVLEVLPQSTPHVVYEGQINDAGMPMGRMPIEMQVSAPYVNVPNISNVYIKDTLTKEEEIQLSKGILTGLYVPYQTGRPRTIRLLEKCHSIDQIWQDANKYEESNNDMEGIQLTIGEFEMKTFGMKHAQEFFLNANGNGSNPNRNPQSIVFYNIIDTEQTYQEAVKIIEDAKDNTTEALEIVADAENKAIAYQIIKDMGIEFPNEPKLAQAQLLKYLASNIVEYRNRLSVVEQSIEKDIFKALNAKKKDFEILGGKFIDNLGLNISIEVEKAIEQEGEGAVAKFIANVAINESKLFSQLYKYKTKK